MKIIPYLAAFTLIASSLCAIEMYYVPSARSTAAYWLVGFGYVVTVILCAISLMSKPSAGTDTAKG